MNTSVIIKNLSVTLGGNVQALANVNLELPVGKTIAIIGPSGAGKTTLIRSIVGRLKVPKGTVVVFDQLAGSSSLRKDISYMTQELSVYMDLTVRENLNYFSTMTGQSKRSTKETVDSILDEIELTDKADILISDLSGGQKQRVSLAVALIGSPKLMVLDEPTAELDPVLRDKLWRLFAKLANQGTTMVISSHIMDEARRCDDLVLIRDGEIIAHSSPQELLERTHTNSVEQAFLDLVGDKK